MAEEEQSKRLVRDFAWWQWLLVLVAAGDGMLDAGWPGALGAAIGMVILIALVRIVVNELRLMHRRDVENAKG